MYVFGSYNVKTKIIIILFISLERVFGTDDTLNSQEAKK